MNGTQEISLADLRETLLSEESPGCQKSSPPNTKEVSSVKALCGPSQEFSFQCSCGVKHQLRYTQDKSCAALEVLLSEPLSEPAIASPVPGSQSEESHDVLAGAAPSGEAAANGGPVKEEGGGSGRLSPGLMMEIHDFSASIQRWESPLALKAHGPWLRDIAAKIEAEAGEQDELETLEVVKEFLKEGGEA